MNHAVFGKTMENVRKCKDIKLVTTERRRNYLVTTKLSYKKIFRRKFISNRIEKTQILMSQPLYLGLSIQDLSKTVMVNFGMIM